MEEHEAARCSTGPLLREEQLITRLEVERLIAAQDWQAAVEIGSAALERGPPSLELLRISSRLSNLGMVGGVSVRETLLPLLLTHGLSESDLSEGAKAIKSGCGDDVDEFVKVLSEAANRATSPAQSLALLHAAVELADSHTTPTFLRDLPLDGAIRLALSDPNLARRAAGLRLIASLIIHAPSAVCSRLCPVLTRAVLIDVEPLQAHALAVVADVASALARLPSTDAFAESAAAQLSSCLQLLSKCLYAPALELQTIAALGLSKLVLGSSGTLDRIRREDAARANGREKRAPNGGRGGKRPRGKARGGAASGGAARGSRVGAELLSSDDEDADPSTGGAAHAAGTASGGATTTGAGQDDARACAREETSGESLKGAPPLQGEIPLLESVYDVEALLAELAFRYTASSAQLDSLPKPAATALKGLMTMLQACFDALSSSCASAEVGNTVVWLLLGCAEEGKLEPLRLASADEQLRAQVLDARTLRCVQFLSSLLGGMPWESAEARNQGVRDLVEAAVVNLQLEHALDVERATVAAWLAVEVV